MTAIRVINSTGSIGAIQVADGGGGFLSGTLIAGSNVTIVDAGSGSFTISSTGGGSTIGDAEDGSYEDGLFTDFTSSTLIGVPIDRFNEVLKALAPNPAPDLDHINALQVGTSAILSFGSSSNQESASPPYISVTATGSYGLATEVDVNGTYAPTTSSNNYGLGIFDGSTHITGVLNDDVAANSQGNSVPNYPEFSFGDADTGVLKLDVNGTVVKEIDLTREVIGFGGSGLGTGSYVDSNGSGFIFLSNDTTGTLSNGNSFASFKHRTGKYVIASSSFRNGWNYARIQHVKTGSTISTNYIEWVVDDSTDVLSSAGNAIDFTGSGSIHLSGIEYFQSGTVTYNNRVSNAYKYVYDNTNITFSTSTSATVSDSPSFSISAQSKPSIGAGEDHTKKLHLTGSGTLTANKFFSGSVTVGTNVTHPFKSNLSNDGQSTVTGILIYNLANSSTNTRETFRREDYRIISGAYDTQASLTDASNVWNSEVHITSSNGGHSDGLQFYNDILVSPKNTLLSGDFRSTADGGNLDNAPGGNPNYSSVSGQRTFYRWFRNTTGATKYDFSIAITGTGTIVTAGTALTGNRVRVFVKFPNNGTRQTGWLDLASEFVLDSYSDNDGAHATDGALSFDSSLNATNYVSLGTVGVANNEYIGVRIEADDDWTGNIAQIDITFGAGTGTLTAVPDLDDIDCNDDGTDSNLSFGSSKSITGYTNVAASAGIGAAVDVNGLYETAASSNNLRRSVFALDTIIEGDLNEDVTANSPDYVANSFSDANSGSLKLEVNGSVIHEVQITGSAGLVGSGTPGSGAGISTGSNGSGFFDLSEWRAAQFDNGVPSYLEIYRTGKYRVHTSDQRNGWNYARVIHSVGGSDRETNYVEWVNDNDANALSEAGVTLQPFGDDTVFNLSGVKYFVQPSGSLEARISNVYKNVYSDSSSAISFTNLSNVTATTIVQSGSGLSSTKSTSSSTDSLQTLNTNTDSQNENLHVTGTLQFSLAKSLTGSFTTVYHATASMVFVHPLKTNLTLTNVNASNFHVYSASDNSNANTNEYFNGEKFRVQSGSYASQAAVTAVGNIWASTASMNDNGTFPGYYTGLMLYDGDLISPLAGGAAGDFRNKTDGGILEGPSSNVNYSSLGEAQREYYRGFLNNTTNDRPSITITLYGDATLVGITGANAASLGANKNIFVECQIPGKSEFLDLGKPSAGAGNTSEGDGCLSGDLDATIDGSGAVNVCTFNGLTVDGTTSGAEYFIIKISAHKNWTGYLSQIAVAWSA